MCKIFAFPSPNITWSGPSITRRTAVTVDSCLLITNVQYLDSGQHFCRASNFLGSVELRTLLILQDVVLPVFIVRPPAIVEYNENDRVSLTCRATGNPKPSVKWSKNGAILNGGVSGTTSEKTLVISSFKRSIHHGAYTCTAINNIGDKLEVHTFIVKQRITCWRMSRISSGSWGQHSSDTPDAIDFSVNVDRYLRGYLLWGPSSGSGSYTIRMEIYDDQGTLLKTTTHSVTTSSTTYQVLFSSPVLLRANRWYSAVAHIVGPGARKGIGGVTSLSCSGTTVRFRSSSRDKNHSKQSWGQIPAILLA